ncbi:Putative vacuolar membrane transporter for cationic amino acids [Rhodotorula kratochvilovae]
MLSQLELISSLFGYMAMGTGIWLFCPEVYDLLKYPPRTIDTARLIFFAAWLAGDVLHLIGTVVSGHALITQIALYCIVAFIETALVNYILWCTGKYCCTRRRHPDEEIAEEKARLRPVPHEWAAMHGVGPDLAMPPGDTALEDARAARWDKKLKKANESRARRGKKGEWASKEEISNMRAAVIQTVGTIVVVGVFTAIWVGVVYIKRDTAKPPEPMKMPHNAVTWLGYILGWIGFFFWTGPRFYSMYDAVKAERQEGITTGSISVGALTHGFNVASVMIINNQGEALYAQLPYIATSALCIFLDFVRLGIKFHYGGRQFLAPEQDHSVLYPAKAFYDPRWQFDREEAEAFARKRDALAEGRPAPPERKPKKSKKAAAGAPSKARRLFKRTQHDPLDSSDAAHSKLGSGSGSGFSDAENDPDSDDYLNGTQRHAAYLSRAGGAHGLLGVGLGRQLHPDRYPGESDDDYEDRMIRAKATSQFARGRAEQARRKAAVDELHRQIAERRGKTLRREREYAAPGTSDRRKAEIEDQLRATELRKEPQLHQALYDTIRDPYLSEDDRDELQRHHRKLVRAQGRDGTAQREEDEIRSHRARRLGYREEEEDEHEHGGERAPLARSGSLSVHHPSGGETEEEEEEDARRRPRVATTGRR